eukprot:g398.t1
MSKTSFRCFYLLYTAILGSIGIVSADYASPWVDVKGAFMDGDLKWLPYGFYQYTVTSPADILTTTDEAIHAMSLTCPYVSTASPTEEWYTNMETFLDRALNTGFRVHFQLIAFEKLGNDAETLNNLTAIVERFKSHPALFAWYLADEPDGQGIDPSLLKPKYDLIKKIDPAHPISMVFCAGGAANFLDALDFIMVDPYPIPNGPASSITSAVDQVRALGKPVMMVPQAFGGGEAWRRTPTGAEERLMTYLSVIHGAVGVQYFVRSAPVGFPYAASAWSEIRKVSTELFEIAPAILNKRFANVTVTSSNDAVHVAVFQDRDGSVVVLAANTNSSSTAGFSVDCREMTQTRVDVAQVTFENFEITLSSDGTLSDTLRPRGTAVYRLGPSSSSSSSSSRNASATQDNLVYNGGYELNGCPAVPDGNYVTPAIDFGATFFADPRRSKEGRHSLVLRAPSDDGGVILSPYSLSSISANASYNFSVWIYGEAGNERVEFQFGGPFENATDQPLYATAKRGEWTQFTRALTATSSSGGGWLRYGLSSKGRVWLDELSVTPRA